MFDDIRRAKLVLTGGKDTSISLSTHGLKTRRGRAADVDIPSGVFDGIVASHCRVLVILHNLAKRDNGTVVL
jgi:hypothetical protein